MTFFAEAALYRFDLTIDTISAGIIAAPISGVIGWFTRSLLAFMQKNSADQMALTREVVTAVITNSNALSQLMQELRDDRTVAKQKQ